MASKPKTGAQRSQTQRSQTQRSQTQRSQTQRSQTQRTQTPWGPASVVEEVTLRQRVGDRSFASVVQLLEGPKGEPFVRFAYSTDGVARRGPVTLRGRDLESLRTALAKAPRLQEVLRLAS
jgi:hypothetical protein